MEKVKKHPVPMLIFLILYFLFITCSDQSSGNNKVTFSGIVALEGETDFSGVTVSLYELVELDTALVRINQQYPNIGVQISQQTEFDHREQLAAATATTNPDGSWEIKVEEGIYNIVAEKNGFGWAYIYEIEQGNNNIALKNVITLAGDYLNAVNIPAGSFIEITEDVNFSENASLIINSPVTILFKNNSRLTINGNISFLNEALTTIYNDPTTTNNNNINIQVSSNEKVTLRNMLFFDTFNSLYINNSTDVSISNSIFYNSVNCIQIFNSDSVFISNSIFYNCETPASTEVSNTIITKNIIGKYESDGYKAGSGSAATIEQNLFFDGDNALNVNPGLVTESSSLIVKNNDFIDNRVHINIGGLAIVQANLNNFLFSTDYVVRMPTTNATFDFTSNYWAVFSDFEIGNRIYDVNDISSLGTVNFSSFLFEKVSWYQN